MLFLNKPLEPWGKKGTYTAISGSPISAGQVFLSYLMVKQQAMDFLVPLNKQLPQDCVVWLYTRG